MEGTSRDHLELERKNSAIGSALLVCKNEKSSSLSGSSLPDLKPVIAPLPKSQDLSNMSQFSLRPILETTKLVGENFDEWQRNLRLVLTYEKLIDVIDKPAPPTPDPTNDDAFSAFTKYEEQCITVKCLILASMSGELHKQYEHMDAKQIMEHLKKMFGEQSRTTRSKLSWTLFKSTLIEGSPVGPHVLKMMSLIKQLEKLGCTFCKEMQQEMILHSLPDSFSPFIVNYNMNKMDVELYELHNMLTEYEKYIFIGKRGSGSVLMVGQSSRQKRKGKKRPRIRQSTPKAGMTKAKGSADNVECFFCKKKGHWKRNCNEYLQSLKSKKQ